MALTDEEIEELIGPCILSTAYTGLTLFEDHITRPFCPLHNEIFKLIDDNGKRLVAIAAPRGFGKTTLIGLVYIARLALFRIAPYIVYISATAAEAAQKVKTLARELEGNPLIKELFGDVKGVKWAEEKGEIELIGSDGVPFCFIQAKGAGNQIRGLKWGKHRPSIFLVDDLESMEDAKSEDMRKKLKKWFFGDLLGAMDNADTSESRIVLIGTIVHQDSLLANLIDENHEISDELLDDAASSALAREKFCTIRLEACDDNYESIWPEFISTQAIRAKAEAYRQRGLLDTFFMEFRNIVIAGEAATFQQSMFRYYSEQAEEFRSDLKSGLVETVIIVDPAKTANTTSAFTSIIAVGWNSAKNRIFFRDCMNAKLTPDGIFEEAVKMARIYNTPHIGIEVTGLNNFVTFPFKQYLATQRGFFNLIELKAIKDKELRVAALAPFYRLGVIYHNENMHVRGPLETQLLSFPYSKFWDVMDSFAYFIEMFDIGDRCFTLQPLDGSTPYSIEDEYEELAKQDREDTLNFEYRYAP